MVDFMYPLPPPPPPPHTHMQLPTFQNQSDELQFYYQVNRVFRSVFQTQEQSAMLHTYDKPPEAKNGVQRQQRSNLTFRKPSKWVEFVRIRPRPDPVQIGSYAQIRQCVTEIDQVSISSHHHIHTPSHTHTHPHTPSQLRIIHMFTHTHTHPHNSLLYTCSHTPSQLLSLSSHCTHLHSIQRVLYALRQHYVFVKQPSTTITPLSVKGHVTSHDSMLVWKCIYSGLDSRKLVEESI